ncbi:MAG TPA: HAD hydrolase family protein [Pyrinomonadaceae bacterium]|nr:HAD hydrolase family protein [Pyrinomonadaceae bacterium]
MANGSEIENRASRIKLLLMDCDGVLTDARLWLLDGRDEQKCFSARDGLGIELLHRAGLRSGIISGRSSAAVERRARELGMGFIRQGSENKIKSFEEVLIDAGVSSNEVAFIGDDLNDVPLMRRSGFAVAVADAAEETRSCAHYVTRSRGGYGAVRETIELILKAQGLWRGVVRKYEEG